MLKKGLTVAVILLFIGMSVVHTAGKMILDNSNPTYLEVVKDDDVTFWINGTMGENGWFVSDVLITFVWNPEVIAAVYYSIDGTTYELYTEPIIVEDDGNHELWFYLEDIEGNVGDTYGPFDFKIDQTPPTIDLFIIHIINDTYMIIAEVEDETSGIERVEFYINDILEFTDYEAPYEYICELNISSFTSQVIGMAPIGHPSPLPSDEVAAIVYDYAGNSEMNEIPTIIEENEDIKNYLEKSSDEDCGCDDESSDLGWNFPVICTLLIPLLWFALYAWFMGGITIFGEIVGFIGSILNCFWY
jgi:hypothetical protein